MQIIELNFPFQSDFTTNLSSQVLALGDFDGIHLGHQEVIKRSLRSAETLGQPAAVMTFDPHPRAVLGQAKYEQSLTPLTAKLEFFAQMGVQYVYIIQFTMDFARMSPELFVEQVLFALGVSTVIVGFDFSFGHEGKGTPEAMLNLSQGKFSVEIVPPFHLEGDKVSSTNIREYLSSGRPERANQLLGRTYSLRGKVVTGDGRGRTIGFPTANIEPLEAYVLPCKGVYAVRCHVRGSIFNAVMNIGSKPTFSPEAFKVTLEAHLFDFNDSIYGELVEIEFIQYIRNERKFASIDELVGQIRQDETEAKDLLARHLLL